MVNPPLFNDAWPNGAMWISQNVIRFKGRSVVLGWVHRERSGLLGVWVATKIAQPWHWRQKPKDKLPYIDDTQDYKYVGHYEDRDEACDYLLEAYRELHNTVVV